MKFTNLHRGLQAFKSTNSTSSVSPTPVTVNVSQLNTLIGSNSIIAGQQYIVTGIDSAAYGGTTMITIGTSSNTISNEGTAQFFVPDYTQVGVQIYNQFNPPTLNQNDKIIWGYRVYIVTQNTPTITVTNEFTLSGNVSLSPTSSSDYIEYWNEIIYDVDNDHIVLRRDNRGNCFYCEYQEALAFSLAVGKPISYLQFESPNCKSNSIAGSVYANINNVHSNPVVHDNIVLSSYVFPEQREINCTNSRIIDSIVDNVREFNCTNSLVNAVDFNEVDVNVTLTNAEFLNTTLVLPSAALGADNFILTRSRVERLSIFNPTTGGTFSCTIQDSTVKTAVFNTPTMQSITIIGSTVDTIEADTSTLNATAITGSVIEKSSFVGATFQTMVDCVISAYDDPEGCIYNYPSGTKLIAQGKQVNISFSLVFDGNPGTGQQGPITIPCSAEVPAYFFAKEYSYVVQTALAGTASAGLNVGITNITPIEFIDNLIGSINSAIVLNAPANRSNFTTTSEAINAEAVGDDITGGQLNLTLALIS